MFECCLNGEGWIEEYFNVYHSVSHSTTNYSPYFAYPLINVKLCHLAVLPVLHLAWYKEKNPGMFFNSVKGSN